jgi:hypothetical protein
VGRAGACGQRSDGLVGGRQADRAARAPSDAGLITIEAGIARFSHPSLASTVYEDATPAARRAAHRALADATEEAEARGRHLALATAVPNATVAAALELGARDAQRRGAAETGAELSRLAVARTPPDDDPARQRRSLLLANLLMALPDLLAAERVVMDLIPAWPPACAPRRACRRDDPVYAA